MDTADRFDELSCCVVIPTFNNERTLAQIIADVRRYTSNILVVDDGSTDSTPVILASYGDDIDVITHPQNIGKGRALRNAFIEARTKGFAYAITIDSDGQHFASDLAVFLDEIESNPGTLVIGARDMGQVGIPGKSSFGHKFSNFWYRFETGIKLEDTQSGYRLYPLHEIAGIRCFTNRFEFEIEIIVKVAWKGLPVKNVPVKIYYEKGEDRVTHFRPFQDFTRVSLLNIWFVICALAWYIPMRFLRTLTKENIRIFLRTHFFNREEPASKKAISLGFGVFMGIFPVWGYQMILGLVLAHFLKLNKALFLVAANISFPPLIPVILFLSHRTGALLVDHPQVLSFDNEITFELVKDNFIQYMLGAVLFAGVAGIGTGVLSYVAIKIQRKSQPKV